MSECTVIDETEAITNEKTKRIIEALLFSSNEPLPLKRICEVLEGSNDYQPDQIRDMIDELNDKYKLSENAFHIAEIGNGFIMRTNPEFHPYLDVLYRKKNTDRLSKAAMEVLAIIAYKQPVTRAQIEEIRGVDSSSMVQVLLDREMIENAGKLETPGRPSLYRTTKEFLHYFGLRDHSDLDAFQP